MGKSQHIGLKSKQMNSTWHWIQIPTAFSGSWLIHALSDAKSFLINSNKKRQFGQVDRQFPSGGGSQFLEGIFATHSNKHPREEGRKEGRGEGEKVGGREERGLGGPRNSDHNIWASADTRTNVDGIFFLAEGSSPIWTVYTQFFFCHTHTHQPYTPNSHTHSSARGHTVIDLVFREWFKDLSLLHCKNHYTSYIRYAENYDIK